MGVKIRMTRTGANKDISYRVVATDSRFPRDGKHLEVVGWYDPKKKGVNFALKMDRIEHWKKNGAQLSDTVKSLVRKTQAAAKTSA
jgi:small subunit ribosomal protein S16